MPFGILEGFTIEHKKYWVGSVVRVDYVFYGCEVFFKEQPITVKCFIDEPLDLPRAVNY